MNADSRIKLNVPIPVIRFRRDYDIGRTLLWQLEREKKVRLVRLNTRLYIMPKEVERFTKRLAAGEFDSRKSRKAGQGRA